MGQHGSTWVVVVVPPGGCNILITCQTSGLFYSTPNHPLREFCPSLTHPLTCYMYLTRGTHITALP